MCPSQSIGFMDGVEKLRKRHSPSLRIESRAWLWQWTKVRTKKHKVRSRQLPAVEKIVNLKVLFLARWIDFSHLLFGICFMDGDHCDDRAYRALELIVQYNYNRRWKVTKGIKYGHGKSLASRNQKLENCSPWLDEFILCGINPTSIVFGKAEHSVFASPPLFLYFLKSHLPVFLPSTVSVRFPDCNRIFWNSPTCPWDFLYPPYLFF